MVHTIVGYPSRGQAPEIPAMRLNSLSLFLNEVGYERAIYLFYGYRLREELLNTIIKESENLVLSSPIEIWFHCSDSMAAQQIATIIGKRG